MCIIASVIRASYLLSKYFCRFYFGQRTFSSLSLDSCGLYSQRSVQICFRPWFLRSIGLFARYLLYMFIRVSTCSTELNLLSSFERRSLSRRFLMDERIRLPIEESYLPPAPYPSLFARLWDLPRFMKEFESESYDSPRCRLSSSRRSLLGPAATNELCFAPILAKGDYFYT